MTADAMDYDLRPGYCWRCNAVPAPNPLGCCDPCVADLRAGKTRREATDMEQLARSLAPFIRANTEALRRLRESFNRVAKNMTRVMRDAGFEYIEGHGWLLDADHDPRAFGPRPGSLRRTGRSHR